MPSTKFDDNTILRRKKWVPIGTVIVLSLAAWIVALAGLAGKNLISGMSAESVQSYYVIAALMVTVLGVPVAFLAVRNIQILLARGVWTTASVESISVLSKGGRRPVSFAYVVNQKTYTIKRDVAAQFTRAYHKGSQISLVYDPKRPQRCQPIFMVRN